jgi:pyruvate kinase
VATVGPSCDTYEKLLELVQTGVNVFRLNFSHGTNEQKATIIQHIRQINGTQPFNISILADLQGPKLRVGEIENNALNLIQAMNYYLPTKNVLELKKKYMLVIQTLPMM